MCVRLEEELSAHMRQRVEEHRHRLAASPTAVASDEEPADYIDAFLAEQQRRRQVGAADDEAEDFTGAPTRTLQSHVLYCVSGRLLYSTVLVMQSKNYSYK